MRESEWMDCTARGRSSTLLTPGAMESHSKQDPFRAGLGPCKNASTPCFVPVIFLF